MGLSSPISRLCRPTASFILKSVPFVSLRGARPTPSAPPPAVVLPAPEWGRRPKAPRPLRLSSVLPEIAPKLPPYSLLFPDPSKYPSFPFQGVSGASARLICPCLSCPSRLCRGGRRSGRPSRLSGSALKPLARRYFKYHLCSARTPNDILRTAYPL